MGWETRNGSTYYYRKKRVGGRVVSEYVGPSSSEATALFALLDADGRARRDADRAEARRERDGLAADMGARDRRAAAEFGAVTRAVDAALGALGYRRHKRGAWRRVRGVKANELHRARVEQQRFEAAHGDDLKAARRGDKQALADLVHKAADDTAALIAAGNGDLDAYLVDISAQILAWPNPKGPIPADLVELEAIRLHCAGMYADLAGPAPSAVVRQLAGRVVMCWLRLHMIEYQLTFLDRVPETRHGMSGYEWLDRFRDRAHRRHLSALLALAKVKALDLPPAPVQINVARQQVVNPPLPAPTAAALDPPRPAGTVEP